MQFCIYCGEPLLTHQAKPPAREEPSLPSQVLVCSMCKRSDPLHGVFCVFCGGRTVSPEDAGRATLPSIQVTQPTPMTSEYPYANLVSQAPPVNMGAVIVMGVVGILVGTGSVFAMKGMGLEASLAEGLWPSDGLVLYSERPGANVVITDNDERAYFFGMTGATGNLSVDHLPPGTYRVKIEGLRTRVAHVKIGEAEVLGYPERISAEGSDN